MENKIVIDFREVQPKDLLGNPIRFDELFKQICNALFTSTGSIGVFEVARKIYIGETTEVDQQTINELIHDVQRCLIPIVSQSAKEYLLGKQTELQNNLKQQ